MLDGTPANYQPKQGRGQSVVEMALILPILLVLLAGIAEIGWFTNNYLILLSSSREGAREGTKAIGQADPYSWEDGAFDVGVDLDGDDISEVLNTLEAVYRIPDNAEDCTLTTHHSCNARMVFGIDYDLNDNDTIDPVEQGALSSLCRPELSAFYVGFYTQVACTAYNSLSPLNRSVYPDINATNDDAVRARLSLDSTNSVPRNDVIVSVFSLNRVPSEDTTVVDDICDGDSDCEDAISNLYRPFENNPDSDFQARAENASGAQVMVTGRFPANANECADDTRDPFDIDANDQYDPYELDAARLTILNSNANTRLFDSGASSATDNNHRGFSLTGRWLQNAGGEDCYGSEWNIDRIEALVNLRGVDSDGDGDLEILEADIDRVPDRQGIVLVEIFWRHDLLLDLPLYGNIFRMFGSGNPTLDDDSTYLNVWAAFPISTVNLDLEFDNDCDDILVLSDAVGKQSCPAD